MVTKPHTSTATPPVLSADMTLHDSELLVADLVKMTDYYSKSVGLEIIKQTKTQVTLGYNGQVIIRLVAKPSLPFAAPNEAGLFHNAILYESRAELANTLLNMLRTTPELYTGAGDHLVSEAFYFNDPEGNGVEIYYDRPRETWQWQDGMVEMDVLYIDPVQYIKDYSDEKVSDTNKVIGHIHLKVGNIGKARQFYEGVLGFAVTTSMPGALFVAIGGYHHRIGMNTWLSAGAGPRKKTLGYSNVIITLDSPIDITALIERLDAAKIIYTYKNDVLRVADPWNNDLSFTA